MPTNLCSPDFLETVRCNLCGASDSRPWAKADGFEIIQCLSCGLVYVNPRLNSRGLQIAYGEEYFGIHTEAKALEKRQRMYEIEIQAMEALRPSGKILDVGCGGGYFLSQMGKQWEKHGVEFNPIAAENAGREFGLNVRVGTLPELGYAPDQFDVVSMRGVIEHFPDPAAYVAESYRVLKKGGLIAINTPNIGSLCARIFRGKFRLVDPIHHIYYFSTRTLIQLLEKTGFKVRQVRYFYLGTPYAHWTDPLKLVFGAIRLMVDPSAKVLSPAFFDNVVHVYAEK